MTDKTYSPMQLSNGIDSMFIDWGGNMLGPQMLAELALK